ncbi:MAG: TolC family protein [Bacteroidales bacterium]|jgi:outer membrane protein TolC|nr:TolC family protein [Bacteroidales bacterium]
MDKQKFVNQTKRSGGKFLIVFLFLTIHIAVEAQDWSLQQCIDTAQAYNKTLQISKNNRTISEQKHLEARANLIPKVNIAAEYKYFNDLPTQLMPQSAFGGPEGVFKATEFGVPHNISSSIQMSVPLYNPQIYGAIKITQIASELSELQVQKTEEQLYFDISNLYYNAQILQHQKAFADSNYVNTNRLLKNLTLLREQLMIKGSDVSKVQLQAEQIAMQQQLIQSNYEQVMNALKFSMGISLDENIQIESEIEYESISDYENHSTLNMQITSTYNRILNRDLKTLKNSRLPSLALYGAYGTTGFGYTEKPNDFLNFYPLSFAGLQIAYPLFNGTITMKRIKQKKIEIQNNELQIELVKDQNSMLLKNARNQKLISVATIEMSSSQIQLAQSIYNQSILQQKEGIATLADVLLADGSLREAQQAYLTAVVNYLKADLEVKKLTGNISIKN